LSSCSKLKLVIVSKLKFKGQISIGGFMTVVWTVKAVEEWCEEHGGLSSYKEAREKFGRWIHSASYESCSELRRRVEEYLESKKTEPGDLLALRMFCGAAIDTELEYNERIYNLLKEALRHIAETGDDIIIRSHAKVLIELITVAEKLKSGIVCFG